MGWVRARRKWASRRALPHSTGPARKASKRRSWDTLLAQRNMALGNREVQGRVAGLKPWTRPRLARTGVRRVSERLYLRGIFRFGWMG